MPGPDKGEPKRAWADMLSEDESGGSGCEGGWLPAKPTSAGAGGFGNHRAGSAQNGSAQNGWAQSGWAQSGWSQNGIGRASRGHGRGARGASFRNPAGRGRQNAVAATAPQDGQLAVAQWAAELGSFSEQLRAIASRAPAVLGLGVQARSVASGTDLSGEAPARWQSAAAELGSFRAEASVVAAQVAAAEEEAAVADAARARSLEAVANAASAAAEAEERRREEHRRLASACSMAAASFDTARCAVPAASEETRRQAGAREQEASELRAALAAAEGHSERAQLDLTRAAEAQALVRDMSAIQARRQAVEQHMSGTEADCQQLRRAAEQLRAGLEAPTSASAKAEALEGRLGRLERDCQELQDSLASKSPNSDGSEAARAAAASLGLAQGHNRHLASEVREARAARDEAASRQSWLEAEVVAARWQCTEVSMRNASAREQATGLQEEVLQCQEEVSELERSLRRAESHVARRPGEGAADGAEHLQLQELDACRRAAEEERAALLRAEAMVEAQEQECERLVPDGQREAKSRNLCSAKSKTAKARGQWQRVAAR